MDGTPCLCVVAVIFTMCQVPLKYVEYDWEMGKLTIDEENWKEYFRHSEQ